MRSPGPLLSVAWPHRAAASLLSQLGLPAGPAPSGELPLGGAWPGRPGQLCPAEAAADPAVACARGGRRGGGSRQELWAPGWGYIMYHLPAPLRAGIGFLCLLLAGAAWALRGPQPLGSAGLLLCVWLLFTWWKEAGYLNAKCHKKYMFFSNAKRLLNISRVVFDFFVSYENGGFM